VLEALRTLLRENSIEALSRILRIPSVESMVSPEESEVDLLTLIDSWRADRIGGTLEDLRCANRGRRSLELAPLRDALCVLEELVQPIRVAESAHATCAALGVFLERLFAERLDDVQLHEELAPVEEILQTLASEPTGFAPSIEVVIELCLETLARSKRRPASHDNAVELLGWLELRHDPARDVVLVAVNESGELASKVSDGWLPDSKRQELGLFDEAHRRARDAHATHVLCNRTRSIRAIIARRNVKGDPISPSRLFLGSGGVQSACRITATMDDKVQSPRTVPAFALAGTPVPASKPCFDAPKPPASIEVTKLSVTAFASWIRSPMRFWLERLEGLESIDPEALELDPLAFGSLAHDVFQSFGEGQVHDSTDDEEIFAFLEEELDRLVVRRYGRPCAPAIALQRATLRTRFEHFAHVQAKAVLDGWHILESECTLEATLEIPDGESIQLRGRIDRIDRHEDGRLRVLDYKTSEKRTVPAKARTKSGIWHDLQLPLYHHLMRAQKDTSASEILVGYVSLCREPKEIDIEIADWNAEVMEEGIRRAQEIVHEMRSGEFSEGIAKPPRSVDAIARILRTGVLDIGTGFDTDEAEVLD
jgi:RecB family exonuclease